MLEYLPVARRVQVNSKAKRVETLGLSEQVVEVITAEGIKAVMNQVLDWEWRN